MNKHKIKEISALMVVGFSCVFGTSWLYMAPNWIRVSGNFSTAALGLLLGTGFVMLVSIAYGKMLENSNMGENEVEFAEYCFGRTWAGLIGWCGFLTNLFLCSWQIFALINTVDYILGGVKSKGILYGEYPHSITYFTLLIGFALLLVFGILHIKGIEKAVAIQTLLTGIILFTVVFSVVFGIYFGSTENVFPSHQSSVIPQGVIGIVAIVPFSLAGWENTIKISKEVAPSLENKVTARIMTLSILMGGLCYIIMLFAQVALVPTEEFLKTEIPFLRALEAITGNRVISIVLALSAALNVCNVFNGMFLGATRTLFIMANRGYIPKFLGITKGKKALPRNAIITVLLIIAVVPLVGSSIFTLLVQVTSVFYILIWGSTVFCNFKTFAILRNRLFSSLIGSCCIALILFTVIPISSGSLKWPSEHLFLVGALFIGWVLLICNQQKK